MMGFGYGAGMMGGLGAGTFGLLGFVVWIVVFVDLILLGAWLWKQLQKK